MAEERTYNVPLRKEWLKVPRYKRAKKALRALRSFIVRHMKTEKVIIGKFANEKIWKDGIRSPPHHIKIHCAKVEGKVVVELEGKPLPDVTKKEEEKEKSKLAETIEKLTGKGKKPKKKEAKKETPKPETKTEAKKEEAKPEAKKAETKQSEAAAKAEAPAKATPPPAPTQPPEGPKPKDPEGQKSQF